VWHIQHGPRNLCSSFRIRDQNLNLSTNGLPFINQRYEFRGLFNGADRMTDDLEDDNIKTDLQEV
jgi:hypothetical protein